MSKRLRPNSLFASAALIFSLLLCLPTGAAGQNKSERTGEELYKQACATCHGINGKAVPSAQLGFDIPIADLTDCRFTNREPDTDWVAVAHDGGPARGFSKLMPAFGGVLSKEEIELVVAHARTFCPDRNWPRGELNLPRPIGTEKAFIEDEAVITTSITAEGERAISNKFVFEKRFGARNQFEMVVPFGWEKASPSAVPEVGNWIGGIGDVAVGAKRAFYHSRERGTIFSAAGEFILPVGDRNKGLGKGTTIFEPFVSFGQLFPSDFFLHAQAGMELPFDTDRSAREAFWRLAAGKSITQGAWGRTWSPIVELLAARELVTGEKISWDILPQIQWTLSKRQHIMMDIGVRLPVTDAGPRDTQIVFYLLWDWFDGGLREGW